MTERWADWIAERFVSEPLDAPEIGPGVKTAYVVASAIPVGAAIAVTMYAQEIWEIAHGHTYLTPELPEQSHAATPDAHPAPAPAAPSPPVAGAAAGHEFAGQHDASVGTSAAPDASGTQFSDHPDAGGSDASGDAFADQPHPVAPTAPTQPDSGDISPDDVPPAH